jgi:hypothetical protein
MDAKNKLTTIRFICWMGAAADALWAVALLHPHLYEALTGRPQLQVDMVLRLTMGIGASLMAGWTVLLVWASRDPVERRAVLLFTGFPVLAGLTAIALIGSLSGNMAGTWIVVKCAFLFVAMLWGYHGASIMAKAAEEGSDA